MKKNRLIKFCLAFTSFAHLTAQENAAPSVHLIHDFTSNDAILKMQKIKITQSANATYFEVNNFTNGYSGLQQTADKSFGKPNILISSLWDADTAAKIYSNVDYKDPSTFTSRFGGEGDGYKSINPYDWSLNIWYNLVHRSWKANNRLYIATFINNLSNQKWFHTATLSIPDPNKYLTGYNDAFLENWNGISASQDGRYVRKAFFKDAWNINTNGVWEKNIRTYFSANDSAADVKRNGIYHNSFNSFFDSTEDAYCMQHGGDTTRSAAFNNTRVLVLGTQTNQGNLPVLTIGSITSATAQYNAGITNVNWVIDELKSPQLSVKIDILDSKSTVLKTVEETLPEKRSMAINEVLANGNYKARVTITDIFNQSSTPQIIDFQAGNVLNTQEIGEIDGKMSINPNPAKTHININGNGLKKARIVDVLGRIFFDGELDNNTPTLDVSSWPNGVYHATVSNIKQETYNQKIIISH